jgi:hypothetical protein
VGARPAADEEDRVARERHETAFVVGAIAGGVAGAVWGLLNASVPGREARSELALQVERAADQLVIAAADFEVVARQWLGLDPAPDAAALAAAWPPAFEPPPAADRTVTVTVAGALVRPRESVPV